MRTNLWMGVFLWMLAGAAFAAPQIQHWQTDNGVRVYFVETHDLPLLDVSVDFAAGSSRDPADKGGLAAIVQRMLALGAGGLSEDEISRRLADVGATLGGNLDLDRAGLGVRTLVSERGQALDILARLLQQPEFPEAVLQREKNRIVAGLKEAETRPEHLVSKAFYAALYGTHPYGRTSSGEVATVGKVTRNDVADFYRAHYRAANAVVAIVGDVTREQATQIALQLTRALPGGAAVAALPPVARDAPPQVRKIAHPATQSHILLGVPGIRRGDPDYFPLFVGNYILGGGGFDSRLLEEVRQKRGLAYSTYSYFLPLQQEGPFQIGLQTKREQVNEALVVVRDTLTKFIAEGPSAADLRQAQDNIGGGFPLRIDSNRKILDHLAVIGFYGLPLTYLDDFVAQVERVTVAQVRDAFTRRIQPDRLVTVVVGGNGQD